jgi:hypothetical protein
MPLGSSYDEQDSFLIGCVAELVRKLSVLGSISIHQDAHKNFYCDINGIEIKDGNVLRSISWPHQDTPDKAIRVAFSNLSEASVIVKDAMQPYRKHYKYELDYDSGDFQFTEA